MASTISNHDFTSKGNHSKNIFYHISLRGYCLGYLFPYIGFQIVVQFANPNAFGLH